MELVTDPGPARWLAERLIEWRAATGVPVAGVVPSGFEAYAQVYHHVERYWPEQMPAMLCAALASALRPATADPERCWFGVWNGFGDEPEPKPAALKTPSREYFVYRAPLAAALLTWAPAAWLFRSPNLWWPNDRAWCVGTDIDLVSTYVGGSRDAIRAVLAAPGLHAVATTATARVDGGRDEPGWPDLHLPDGP